MLKGGPASTTQVPAKVSCTDSTCKTVVLNPDKKLAKLKKYTVKVEGAADTDGLAVEDLMSNALVQDHAKSFKTGAR